MEGVRIFAYANGAKQKSELLPQPDGTYSCDAAPGHNNYYFHAVNTYGSIYYFKGNTVGLSGRGRSGVLRGGNLAVRRNVSDQVQDHGPVPGHLSVGRHHRSETHLRRGLFPAAGGRPGGAGTVGEEDGLQATFELPSTNSLMGSLRTSSPGRTTWSSSGKRRMSAARASTVWKRSCRKRIGDGYLEVTIYGAAKYLPAESEGQAITFDMTVEATDKFGHTGSTSIDVTATNTKPQVVNNSSVHPEYQEVYSGSWDRALMLPFKHAGAARKILDPARAHRLSDGVARRLPGDEGRHYRDLLPGYFRLPLHPGAGAGGCIRRLRPGSDHLAGDVYQGGHLRYGGYQHGGYGKNAHVLAE